MATGARLPRLPRRTLPVLGRGPKELRQVQQQERPNEAGEPPDHWTGTRPEWWAYWALLRLGKKPDVDFRYQSSAFGGRLQRGGAVMDFEILDPPGLGININGVFWHYARGSQKLATDALQRAQTEGTGIRLVVIDDDDLGRDPIFYVREALKGIDHSRVARGLN